MFLRLYKATMLESAQSMTNFGKSRVRFGPFEADLRTQELWKGAIRLKLGGQPFGILSILLERPGQLVTREELRTRLWSSDTFVDFNHGLNAAVNKLRECLNDSPDDPKYIETLPRRGYRFIGSVTPVETSPPTTPPAFQNGNGTALVDTQPGSVAADSAAIRVPPSATQPFTHEIQFQPPSFPAARVSVPYRWIAIPVLIAVSVASLALLAAFVHKTIKPFGRLVTGDNIVGVFAQPCSDPAFSPDGERVAYRHIGDAARTSGIYVASLVAEKELQLSQNEGDCCPAWSRDGKQIAFTRTDGDVQTIFIASAQRGNPEKLRSAHHKYGHGEVEWAPDGKSIVFTGDSAKGGAQLFAVNVDSLDTSVVTQTASGEVDWGPTYSPDGQFLAFVRHNDRSDNLYIMRAQGSPAQQITSANSQILGPPAWSADGQSLIYASNQDGPTRLWRIPVSGGTPVRVPRVGDLSWHPSVSHKTNQLAYQHVLDSSSIARLDSPLQDVHAPRIVVASTSGRNESPVLSPNGKKLAFMSQRSGTSEIWVSDPDGSYPSQLTHTAGAGTPRWSPDSQSIVFDSVGVSNRSFSGSDTAGIYIVDVTGGEPRALVQGSSNNLVPSFSRDGQWVYFASDRSGQDQVWKISVNGGDPMQVTHHGGFAAVESTDGKLLYYASSKFPRPEIWVMPVGGGPETQVSPLIRPDEWANWAVTDDGMFFIASESSPTIAYFDFKSRQLRAVMPLNVNSFWLSAAADGSTLWFQQEQHGESTIMIQRNFH